MRKKRGKLRRTVAWNNLPTIALELLKIIRRPLLFLVWTTTLGAMSFYNSRMPLVQPGAPWGEVVARAAQRNRVESYFRPTAGPGLLALDSNFVAVLEAIKRHPDPETKQNLERALGSGEILLSFDFQSSHDECGDNERCVVPWYNVEEHARFEAILVEGVPWAVFRFDPRWWKRATTSEYDIYLVLTHLFVHYQQWQDGGYPALAFKPLCPFYGEDGINLERLIDAEVEAYEADCVLERKTKRAPSAICLPYWISEKQFVKRARLKQAVVGFFSTWYRLEGDERDLARIAYR